MGFSLQAYVISLSAVGLTRTKVVIDHSINKSGVKSREQKKTSQS